MEAGSNSIMEEEIWLEFCGRSSEETTAML
jgi:hypothetical protein